MSGSVKKIYLTADTIDLSKKQIVIKQIELDEPTFTLSDYTGKNTSITVKNSVPSTPFSTDKLQRDIGGWMLIADKVILKNGTFTNERETERLAYNDRFDGLHFKFVNINGELNKVLFINDTLTSNIKLSTKEKSGFEIKQLMALVKVTPNIMEFNKLDIITDKSRIGDYYLMRYNNFNSDMKDFLHRVFLKGRFVNSKIHTDDISYFAPELKNWKRTIYFNGNAVGSIDNIAAENFTLKSNNTLINGDISLKGLPDIYGTFIDFKAKSLQTNYTDISTLVPALNKINKIQLHTLGKIHFKGNFTGFIKDFVTYGNLSTALGNFNADINMKLEDNQKPIYSGKISSAGLNLGPLFNTHQLGKMALNGKVKGTGFTLETLHTDFNGKIQRVEFLGYPYQNISINGLFIRNLFTGNLNIDDPNLVIKDLNGFISLAGDSSKFNFDANMQKANLKELKFTKKKLILSGQVNVNFIGTNIDNFLGAAKMYNATLMEDSAKLSFDYLTLRSSIEGVDKTLTIKSNELEGSLKGQFKILELPDAFKVFLNRYYPSYFEKPILKTEDQDFSFLIKTKEVNEYVQLFDQRLQGFNNAVFSGNLKLAKNEFNINATVPKFSYDDKVFENIILSSKGNDDSLNTKILVKNFNITDSTNFPNTQLILNSKNDVSNIQLSTSASKTLSDAQLNARIQTYNDGVKVHLFQSSFILNDKKWNLGKDGEVTLRKSYVEANDVRFTQGNQDIVISTELDQLTNQTNLIAKLQTVNINDFTPLFLKQPRLEGLLTGTIKLKDPFGKPIIEFDTKTEAFRLDNKEIGNLQLIGNVNSNSGLVTATGAAAGKLYNFNIDGNYNYKDTSANQMNFIFNAKKFDISILDNYLGGIFNNMKGNLISDLKVYGGPNHKYVTGTVNITDGELNVIYTQCKYKFSNETILFNPDEIDFGLLQLKDSLNNTGIAGGKLQHHFFDQFSFNNIRFETAKMLLLNTNKKDNNQFYGKVIGKAVMTLNGPISDMRMNITGEPSKVDSSHIFIPTSSGSEEFGKIDYIDFIQYGSKMQDEFKNNQETNFLVNMNLTANPACKIDVILDEITGDIIKGQGNGLINIIVGSKEPLTMRGKYDITAGEYKFNFQTFLQKYFTINKGSITWNGDPYEAQINIDAEYLAHNVDLSSLATSRGKFQLKSNLNIIAHLTNTLKAPKINFDFEIPENQQTDYSKDPVLLENLKKFSKDENEQNRQVASLLLFNSFINDNNIGFGASTASFLSGTAGQVISGFLSNQLTKVFQKLFKDPTLTPYLNFNSRYNLTSTELINALEASGNFGFIKTYLDGKLVVSLGGNIDYNNPYILQARNTNVLLTPDITVEYMLSKDGKLRIVGFNRTMVDATIGQRNRTGLRLSFNKDFDKLTKAERMKKQEKRKKKGLKG